MKSLNLKELAIIIPAWNEESCIEATILGVTDCLGKNSIPYEVIVVLGDCTDSTEAIVDSLSSKNSRIRYVFSYPIKGFGHAVRTGFENCKSEYCAIVMADASDDPEEIVKFYNEIVTGFDCVFGTRFSYGGKVYDYPRKKLLLNRIFNWLVQITLFSRYDDFTNAFKMYRTDMIYGLGPIISHHFNITIELPIKTITRGYDYKVLPNSWRNRARGQTKLRVKEMGSRYLFILLYCLVERAFSRGDYVKDSPTGYKLK